MSGKPMVVAVKDLKAGDYVVPAKAVVSGVDLFAGLAIVDFSDKSATAPIPSASKVEIIRN